jgi:hypothetical protein
MGYTGFAGFEGLLRKAHLRTEAGFRPRFSPSRCGQVRSGRYQFRYQVWNLFSAECDGFRGRYELSDLQAFAVRQFVRQSLSCPSGVCRSGRFRPEMAARGLI